MSSIKRRLDQALSMWQRNQKDDAFFQLLTAVHDLNRREQRVTHFTNRLVAENMFAIVRLEISQGAEQVINHALAVKRKQTGSGKAEFTLNVTGTLVMLAGNIMTQGSMGLLGNILIASGELLQSAAKNDIEGTAKGVLKLGTATGNIASSEGQEDWVKQTGRGFQLVHSDEVEDGKVETQNTTEGVTAMVDSSGEALIDLIKGSIEYASSETPSDEVYEVTRRRTAFIPHGAGGTHAITTDVQEAVTAAYAAGLRKLNKELQIIARTDGRPNLPKRSILGAITQGPMSPDFKGLHPMTLWVLEEACSNLSMSGGARYDALDSGSGMFGRSSVLTRAKRDVKLAYGSISEHLQSSGAIPQLDLVLQGVKQKGGGS